MFVWAAVSTLVGVLCVLLPAPGHIGAVAFGAFGVVCARHALWDRRLASGPRLWAMFLLVAAVITCAGGLFRYVAIWMVSAKVDSVLDAVAS